MSTYIKEGLGVSNELLQKLLGLINPGPTEFMRSLPDSLFVGTSLFALITQSFPLGILVLAMLEFSVLHFLLASVIGSVHSNLSNPGPEICMSGLPSPYLISMVGQLYPKTTFPIAPIILVASTIFYTMFSIVNFRDELKELGHKESEWKLRIPLSLTFSSLLLIGYSFWRYLNGCDTILSTLGSVGLGAVFGGLVFLLHVYLFGRDSINFLGIPLLADRAEGGRPLYVCAKQTSK